MDAGQTLSKRSSMPPEGGVSLWNDLKSQSMNSTPSMRSAKPERLYKVWPGNNKFLFGGRLILGSDAGSLYLSSFLIGCPAFTFCMRMIVRIKEHDPLYGYGVLTIGVILTLIDILFLCMTCFRDPGIIQRNNRPTENEETSSSMELVAAGKSCNLRVQRTKDVVYNGYSIKVKFCDTCKLYRPLRASHCSVCNNCVQKFDHHCPWVGQCIGLRNYRFFIFFISTTTLLCIYVFTFSLVNILRKKESLMRTMSRDMASVFLVCYCFVAVWFVGGLTLFHFYLISRNQTTYENFRYRYDKLSNKNPYNLGLLNNLKQTFFTRTPTAINFRQLVLVEDIPKPEIPSCNNDSITGLGKELEVELARRLEKSGSLKIPSILQNLDYADTDTDINTDSDEKFNKFSNQDSSMDIVQLNSDADKCTDRDTSDVTT